jgi:hypothetical protein
MALEWLRQSLTRGPNYGKAIEQLQAQIKKKRADPRLKLQLAEVYIQAKRIPEAMPLLEAVADDFALQGFAARAIAILKRMVALDKTNTQAEEKLAYLITQQDNPAPSPWRQKVEDHRRGLEIGMEEFDDNAIGMEAFSDDPGPGPEVIPDRAPAPEAAEVEFPDFNEPAAAEAPEPSEAAPVPAPAPAPASAPAPAPAPTAAPAAAPVRVPAAAGPVAALASLDLSDDGVRNEFLELIDMAFAPEAPAAAGSISGAVSASPLFSDFQPPELIALMRNLQLHTFEPGEIIVSQGEPGQSLFVLASGQARAFLKDKGGRNVQVRDLTDGDFFGEIALMLGSPRTATITARTRCELLELGRPELDAVAKTHPRVREILQEFYVKRVNTSVDSIKA